MAVLALAAVVFVRDSPPVRPVASPKRFVVTLPDLDPSVPNTLATLLLPDGSGLIYVGGHDREWRLHLHTLVDGVSRAIPGTERALNPFLSPDGKWVGFSQGTRLKKIALAGGSPVTICELPPDSGSYGGSWGPDDHIVFGGGNGLWRVHASGGTPTGFTTLGPDEGAHTTPSILPDGKTAIFTALRRSNAVEDATIEAVTIATGNRRVLIKGGASARYSPTGHLLYVRGPDLLAVPFDRDRLTVTRTPVLAVTGVRIIPYDLRGQFDLSADGTLAYLPGGGAELQRTLVWVDRTGTIRPLPTPPRPYMYPSLLPDERGAIVEIEETPHNIWYADLTSGALTRLTHESGNHRAVLSPDGRFIAYGSDRGGTRNLFRHATDGSGTPERLRDAALQQNATSWSRDGRWLAFTQTDPKTRQDIWVLPLEGERTARPFLQTASSEESAAFSPDGRWIAYSSDESGRREVLLSAFPGPGPRKPVSTNGGDMPVFSQDGSEALLSAGRPRVGGGDHHAACPECWRSERRLRRAGQSTDFRVAGLLGEPQGRCAAHGQAF